MHSYTLNNWDGSQSKESSAAATPTKSGPSLKHSSSESKPTLSAVSNQVKNPSEHPRPAGTLNSKKSGELGTGGRVKTANGADDTTPTLGRANWTTHDLATAISQAYKLPTSRARSHALPATTVPAGRVQDQTDLAFGSFNSPRITVTTDLTPAQLINAPEKRLQSIARHQPTLTTHRNLILNSTTQLGHPRPRSQSSTTATHQTRQGHEDGLETQKMGTKFSTSGRAIHKRGSTFKPSILDKNTERNTNSTQFINKKENGAIPDTVTGSRLLTKSQPGPQQLPQFTSKPSTLLGAVPDAPKNSLLSHKSSTGNHDKPATQDVPFTSRPPTHPPHSPTLAQISRSTLPTPPSIEGQPSQQTIPSSVPSSPILVSDHDGYTSADAEGESADDLDFDVLEIPQPVSQIQPGTYRSASIIPGTQSNTPNDTVFTASKPTLQTTVHNLFTPPTLPPSQVPSKRKLPGPVMRFAYVEIPPLPLSKRKKDYRPLLGRKRVNLGYSVYWEGGSQQEEESVSEYEPNRTGRASVRGRRAQRGRAKESTGHKGRRKEVSVQSKAQHVLPEARLTARQRSQRAKSTPSTILSLRYPSEEPPQSPLGSTQTIEIPDSPQQKPSAPPPPPPLPALPRAKSPSVVAISPPPQTESSPRLAKATLPHPNTNIVTATPHHTTDGQRPLPSHDESDAEKIQVYTVFHPPPTIIYFNTRFVQNAWNGDSAAWASSGVHATRRCVRPKGFIRDTISSENGGGQEGGLQLDVGGRVAWDGCSTDEEQEVEELLLKSQSEEWAWGRTTGAVKAGRKLNIQPCIAPMDDLRSAPGPVPMTPIPKVDLVQVLKSQKAASAQRSQKAKKREGKAAKREARPFATAPISTSISATQTSTQAPRSWPPQPSPESGAGLQQLSQPPRYLSAKARGKQKAVEPEPIDIIAPSFRDAIVLSPTSTVSASYHSANPHESFDRQMEDYIVFDLVPSPEKQPREAGTSGDSNSAKLVANSIPTASSSSAAQNNSPYRWQHPNTHTSDLFLYLSPPRDPAPSILGHLDGLALDSFYDSFGLLPEGEKSEQMSTVNPAFLSSNHDDYGTDLELDGVTNEGKVLERGEYARKDELGPRISDEGAGVRPGYQTVRDPPIVVSSRSSTSSYFPSTTSEGLGTIAPALLAARTSSPEFSDYRASNHVSRHQRLRDNRTSQTSSGRSSLAFASDSRARKKALIIDEGEEDESQRCFDLPETDSAADDRFMGSPSYEELSLPRRKWQKRTKKAPLVRLVQPVASTVTVASTRQFEREPEWELCDEESYCHQCRNKTRRLKMTCLCEKKFCIRCMTVRYPSFPFQPQLDDFDCPFCRDTCDCTHCTRKRGEVYVSLRVSMGLIPQDDSVGTPAKKPSKRLTIRPSVPVHSRVIPLPLPEPISDLSGPFSFWGSIYDLEGEKIANAFSGVDEDKVVIAQAVEGYERPRITEYLVENNPPPTRTFVGACQPSWGFGANPIIKELGRRRSRVHSGLGDCGTRWFVGKEYLLHCPVVPHDQNLLSPNLFSDLSSLSPLSDASDHEEGSRTSVSPKSKIFSGSINTGDSIKNVNNFDLNAVETRDTVRALVLALEACGLVVKIDQSLPNR